jgi:hypothetical protein
MGAEFYTLPELFSAGLPVSLLDNYVHHWPRLFLCARSPRATPGSARPPLSRRQRRALGALPRPRRRLHLPPLSQGSWPPSQRQARRHQARGCGAVPRRRRVRGRNARIQRRHLSNAISNKPSNAPSPPAVCPGSLTLRTRVQCVPCGPNPVPPAALIPEHARVAGSTLSARLSTRRCSSSSRASATPRASRRTAPPRPLLRGPGGSTAAPDTPSRTAPSASRSDCSPT